MFSPILSPLSCTSQLFKEPLSHTSFLLQRLKAPEGFPFHTVPPLKSNYPQEPLAQKTATIPSYKEQITIPIEGPFILKGPKLHHKVTCSHFLADQQNSDQAQNSNIVHSLKGLLTGIYLLHQQGLKDFKKFNPSNMV